MMPLTVSASETVWDFTVDGVNDPTFTQTGNSFGNTLSTSNNGIDVTISAWSNTGNGQTVESAFLDTNRYGLLNTNRNSGDGHYIDNGGPEDFVLLSFSTAIRLTGVNFGLTWSDNDFSIAAFNSAPTFSGQTWDSVASSAIFKSSFSQFTTGSHDLSSFVGTEARYWLIGAYHAAFVPLLGNYGFGDNNDGFKLAGITTSNSVQEVNAPFGVGLLGLFAIFYMRRRQKA